MLTPPAYLHAADNIPNNGLLRRIDMLNSETVLVTSLEVVAEFLQQKAGDYTKIPEVRRFLRDMLGDGLVTAEGHDHKVG